MNPAITNNNDWQPKIVALVCTYCTYTAADMAGSLRLQYPPEVRIVKLPCTGKVDTIHLLKTMQTGVDAILVGGCEAGDCHFREGNLRARERVEYTKALLAEAGIAGERLEMYHIGASDAPQWVARVNEMVARVKKLGPNPLRLHQAAGGIENQRRAVA
ncbi:MAG: hydrogenase iron-sulfur subunit [Desulfobacca sp.]|nr:hydrogenase iron-sulfur subunit [Desulfobacca sp.]